MKNHEITFEDSTGEDSTDEDSSGEDSIGKKDIIMPKELMVQPNLKRLYLEEQMGEFSPKLKEDIRSCINDLTSLRLNTYTINREDMLWLLRLKKLEFLEIFDCDFSSPSISEVASVTLFITSIKSLKHLVWISDDEGDENLEDVGLLELALEASDSLEKYSIELPDGYNFVK